MGGLRGTPSTSAADAETEPGRRELSKEPVLNRAFEASASPEVGNGTRGQPQGVRGRGTGLVFSGARGGGAPIYKLISPSKGGEGEAQ